MRHNSWRATKNYHFSGQVVATRKNGVLSYLHGDQLGSTVLTTNSGGNATGGEGYYAYRRFRVGNELGTENRFTAPSGLPKLDATGLMYYNARLGLKPQADSSSWLKPNCAAGASSTLAR